MFGINQPTHQPRYRVSPLVRLWILRIIFDVGGHTSFIREHAYGNDDVSWALGVGQELEKEKAEPYDQATAWRKVRAMYVLAERAAARARLPQVLADNLERLTKALALTRTDCRLLAFAILLRIEQPLSSASGMIGTLDTTRTIQVLARITGLRTRDVTRSLAPHGLLARSGLLTLSRHGGDILQDKLDLLSDSFADLLSSSRVEPAEVLRGTICRAPAPE